VRRLGERLRKLVVRSSDGVLRPAYVSIYELVARAVGAYLRRINTRAAVYATSSLATGELVPGVSDLDLAVVVPPHGSPGSARQALEARRDRLWRLLPPLGRYVWVGVYEDHELSRAQTVSLAQPVDNGNALFFGRKPLVDDLNLSSRPSFPGRVHRWRLLAGDERRGEARRRSRAEDRLAAWVELQAWWQWAVQACLDPTTPGRASLCVKLVAEPCRILLWLQNGEELPTRRQVLARALEVLPSERDAITAAIELRDRLTRSPKPPLDQFLPAFVRLSALIAALLSKELAQGGSTPVRLDWGGADELALSTRNLEQLKGLTGEETAHVLPLADWRGLAAPIIPDECLVPTAGDPGDPDAVAAAARAGSPAVYAALRSDDLLVLPPSDVYWLGAHRCVHFPGSDPVSFALLEGASVARFPNHPGLSIADVAARAVAEHRAYLDVQLHEPGWDVKKLGMVLSAARAALLAETAAAGEPVLTPSMAATARALGERLPEARALAEEASIELRRRRREGGPTLDSLIARLAGVVSSLPSFNGRLTGDPKLHLRNEERIFTA